MNLELGSKNIQSEYGNFVREARKNLSEWIDRSSVYLSLINDLIDSENENQLRDCISALNQFVIRAQILIAKLDKTDFEIGVIGKEKAGKTAMINNWLQIDLLPSKEERCTYTTTEIRACNSEEDQKYRIEYLTLEEYQKHINEIEKLLDESHAVGEKSEKENFLIDSSHEILKEELNDIKKYEESTKKYLNSSPEEKNYGKEMNDRLNKAITSPEEARAVKKVILWSKNLSSKRNVTLYDVPGYDSPTLLHKQQTIEKAGKVDAVIFVKRFDTPSLTEPEINMLQIVDSSDKAFELKDKIIVALSHCDHAHSKSHFNELLKKHYDKWLEIGVSKERIIPICSGLNANKETEKFKNIKNRLETIGIDDGFSTLKECLENFILNMRYYQLKNKYEIEANKLRSVSDKVYSIGVQKIPIDMSEEKLKTRALDERKKRLDQWWAATWKDIYERFEIFFQTKIYLKTNPDNVGTRNNFFDEFRKNYQCMIDCLFQKVESMKVKRQQVIYQSVGRGHGNVSSNEGHIKIRKELSEEVYKAIHEIPPILSRIMFDGITEILDWISRELWGIKEITEELINDGPQSNTIMLKERIEALILRFARPAIDLFLSYPRYDNRRKTMSLYMQEICILDMYFFDEESNSFKVKGLKNFLASGTFAESNPDILNFDTSKLTFSKMTENIEETLKEINDDIGQFANYMKNSVYFASGLESFFKQELDKIALKFEIKEKNERLWQAHVMREIEKGNENIAFEKFDSFIEKQKSLVENFNKIKAFHSKNGFHFVETPSDESYKLNEIL